MSHINFSNLENQSLLKEVSKIRSGMFNIFRKGNIYN